MSLTQKYQATVVLPAYLCLYFVDLDIQHPLTVSMLIERSLVGEIRPLYEMDRPPTETQCNKKTSKLIYSI